MNKESKDDRVASARCCFGAMSLERGLLVSAYIHLLCAVVAVVVSSIEIIVISNSIYWVHYIPISLLLIYSVSLLSGDFIFAIIFTVAAHLKNRYNLFGLNFYYGLCFVCSAGILLLANLLLAPMRVTFVVLACKIVECIYPIYISSKMMQLLKKDNNTVKVVTKDAEAERVDC